MVSVRCEIPTAYFCFSQTGPVLKAWGRWQRKTLMKERHSRAQCHQEITEAPEWGRGSPSCFRTPGARMRVRASRINFHLIPTRNDWAIGTLRLSDSGPASGVVCFCKWLSIGTEKICQGWYRRTATYKQIPLLLGSLPTKGSASSVFERSVLLFPETIQVLQSS